jgi:hypothetical protein
MNGSGGVTLRKRGPPSVDTVSVAASIGFRRRAVTVGDWQDEEDDEGGAVQEEEPVSPTGWLFREPNFRC